MASRVAFPATSWAIISPETVMAMRICAPCGGWLAVLILQSLSCARGGEAATNVWHRSGSIPAHRRTPPEARPALARTADDPRASFQDSSALRVLATAESATQFVATAAQASARRVQG